MGQVLHYGLEGKYDAHLDAFDPQFYKSQHDFIRRIEVRSPCIKRGLPSNIVARITSDCGAMRESGRPPQQALHRLLVHDRRAGGAPHSLSLAPRPCFAPSPAFLLCSSSSSSTTQNNSNKQQQQHHSEQQQCLLLSSSPVPAAPHPESEMIRAINDEDSLCRARGKIVSRPCCVHPESEHETQQEDEDCLPALPR